MPGTFIIKPIEANLTHNTDLITKMSPYCAVIAGNTKINGQICKKGGKHPVWNDAITVPQTADSKVLVQLMDKDKLTRDDNIGSCTVDLREAQSLGHVSKWYPLYYKNKAAGEILLDTVFQPNAPIGQMGQNQYYQQSQQYGAISGQNQYYHQQQLGAVQPGLIHKEGFITNTTTTAQPTMVHQEFASADISRHSDVWVEQRQVVEPHTFMKEVEVVETRPALKDIEVMEPVKMVKEVPVTEAVPIRKQIEVTEPQVVMKEVEVLEPHLVTKTIQVVENVPVTKQVEVVELRNRVQEIETLEPHTFTRQVEVTDFVPTRKQVEVTQPVTLKKAVEFVEPVITTRTITKELQQPVIIDEKITTEVGPATIVGFSREYEFVEQFGQLSLSDRQRLCGHQRWIGFENLFSGLNEKERLFEQYRLSRLNEQEWLRERERLMALNEQARLLEQRRFFNQYQQQAGGFSKFKKTSETVEQTTTTSGGQSTLAQNIAHSGRYNANVNF